MRIVWSAALLTLLGRLGASAQGPRLSYVGQVSYTADAGAVGLGAGVNLHLGPLTKRLGIRLEATFDYFLVDDPATLWEINASFMRASPSAARSSST